MSDQPKLPYHWFVSSCLHWNVHESLSEALARQKRMDRGNGRRGMKATGCHIWRVPVPSDEPYEINYYAPQVDGAVYIGPYAYNKEGWTAVRADEMTRATHDSGLFVLPEGAEEVEA